MTDGLQERRLPRPGGGAEVAEASAQERGLEGLAETRAGDGERAGAVTRVSDEVDERVVVPDLVRHVDVG